MKNAVKNRWAALPVAFAVAAGSFAGSVQAADPGVTPRYRDVTSNDWYYEAVDYAAGKGMMEGTSADLFSPAAQMDRAQFVTVLYRLAGTVSRKSWPADVGFRDVGENAYYHDAVAWAADSGITEGAGPDLFDPAGPVTREQGAVFLSRYIAGFCPGAYAEAGVSLQFPDESQISAWARKEVHQLAGFGLLAGSDGSRFDPQGILTRAEGAEILMRMDKAAGTAGETAARAGDQSTGNPGDCGADSTGLETTSSEPISNADIEKQLCLLIQLEAEAAGAAPPSRDPRLDAAARFILEGSEPDLDAALKRAGIRFPDSKPSWSEEGSRSVSSTRWFERFDHVPVTDTMTCVKYLLRNGSKATSLQFRGSEICLPYDSIGICASGDGADRTVIMVYYSSVPAVKALNVLERIHLYLEEQTALPLYATPEQAEMLELINCERRRAGLGEVRMLPILNEIASARAEEYLEGRSRFGPHRRPDGSDCKSIFREYGIYDFAGFTGENYAGAYSARNAMERLMGSEGHRDQILLPSHTCVGIAKHVEPDHEWDSWVQIFASWN